MLEVDKLLEAKQAANASVANQAPLEELKDNQSKPEESEETDIDIQTTDTEADNTDESSEEDQQDETDLNAGMEHMANLSYDVSVESWDDVRHYGGQALSGLGAVASYLANLGIHYTPIIASKLYKGVSAVMSMLIKNLFKSIYVITKYLERRANSISNLKSSIAGLKSSIEQIKSQEETPNLKEFKYSNEDVINKLKIADSVDFTANMEVLHKFLNDTIVVLDKRIHNEIASVRHIMNLATSGSENVPSSLMNIPAITGSMEVGSVEGYEVDPELNEVSHYKEVLPGDVVFLAILPKEISNEMEQISKAYNSSKMMFGINSKSFIKVSAVDHMTVEALSSFVDSLDKLCNLCEEHQKIYQSIKQLKLTLRFSFRDYLKMMIASSVKVSIKDSLVNYVYLKTMFVDKVYLIGAMDIHDYTARAISTGISLARDHVKRLQ